MWSNVYQVYDDLSPGLRLALEGLRAVHKGTELAASAGLDSDAVTTTHPVVRTHPVTGRKALFVNGNYTERFDGWSIEDSAPLLSYLYAQVGRSGTTGARSTRLSATRRAPSGVCTASRSKETSRSDDHP
jgi:taurine dioxygenase